jgi:hypothetical protein
MRRQRSTGGDRIALAANAGARCDRLKSIRFFRRRRESGGPG